MKYSTLKRLEKLENEEVIEIEDLSEYYRDIFRDNICHICDRSEESEDLKEYEADAKHTEKVDRT